MEKNRPLSPTPDREQTPRTREEQAPRKRLQIEVLEPRLAPTDGGTGGGGWPL
jgi:hypothetical protein